MSQLLRGDQTTARSEVVVFAGLGLAAVMMVSLALVQMTEFVAGSDQVAAALSGRQESLATVEPAAVPKPIVTNTAAPVSGQANARNCTPGKV